MLGERVWTERRGVSKSALAGTGPGQESGLWRHWGLVLTLQDLEVLDVGILGVHVELDASHGDIAEDAVEHLAKSSTGSRNHRLAMGAVSFVS